MILIVSFENNEHVEQVRAHLKTESVLVDVAWFPTRLSLNAELNDQSQSLRFLLPDGRPIRLEEVGAVWYRRIKAMDLDSRLTDNTARLFAWSECNEALLGVWYSMNCFWMNPPVADETSQRKILQLQTARQVGLSIPETLITNDPEAARHFIQSHEAGDVIRKAFRNIAEAPRATSVVQEKDLEVIDSVRYAPVTFQRYVPAALDLRITIVEDDIFAASISSEEAYRADYRPGLGSAEVKPYELPADVSEGLLRLMRALNLYYGAIDMRVTPDGEHVFLEVNPAGEYLFISERTGQPIPAAIAAALTRHDRA
ncbi:MAG TPA: hypothetical protein ENJ80_09570 [Gammaproteobacteria bacterium]|nr:hypothetical protein [Gammaproteobacteria bacterium]